MLWYISFATQSAFLGATIVEADSADDALAKTRRLGINPGGEAAIMALSASANEHPMTRFMMNRLCSKAEIESYGPIVRTGDMTDEQREVFERAATIACDDCN